MIYHCSVLFQNLLNVLIQLQAYKILLGSTQVLQSQSFVFSFVKSVFHSLLDHLFTCQVGSVLIDPMVTSNGLWIPCTLMTQKRKINKSENDNKRIDQVKLFIVCMLQSQEECLEDVYLIADMPINTIVICENKTGVNISKNLSVLVRSVVIISGGSFK